MPCYQLCAAGSTTAQQQACGGSGVYCPAGSTAPIAVQPGYFTMGGTPSTRTTAALCPSPADAGSGGVAVYCTGDGYNTTCPPGVYGNHSGMSTEACDGPCAAGYYCPAGSVSAMEVPCGDPSVYVLGFFE